MHDGALVRRTMIDLVSRRVKPGSGSALEFLRQRTCSMRYPDLREVFGDVPWAAVGAVATRLYMPERLTQVLDVLVAHPDAEKAAMRLEASGYVAAGPLTIGGASWSRADGARIDVLVGDHPWVADALRQASGNRDGHGSPVLPLPYLALMKYEASRFQDVADLSRMLGLASDRQLNEVRAAFRRWMPAEVDDLESLIAIARLETDPPAQ